MQWDWECFGKRGEGAGPRGWIALLLPTPNFCHHTCYSQQEWGKTQQRSKRGSVCATELRVCARMSERERGRETENGCLCAQESKWLRGISNEKCVT